MDGAGKPLQGIAPEIQNTLDEAKAGIVLSIDQQIQYIAEQAAKKYIDRGAVVVLEPKTGQVLAMVSLPDFQQDTLVEALDDERSPLLNRALCNYNCGSVFKIVSAAAALEAGVSLSESHTCTGSINVGGISFHCHNRLGHGVMSMVSGFAQSCNPYFIQLMQGVGGEALYTICLLYTSWELKGSAGPKNRITRRSCWRNTYARRTPERRNVDKHVCEIRQRRL